MNATMTKRGKALYEVAFEVEGMIQTILVWYRYQARNIVNSFNKMATKKEASKAIDLNSLKDELKRMAILRGSEVTEEIRADFYSKVALLKSEFMIKFDGKEFIDFNLEGASKAALYQTSASAIKEFINSLNEATPTFWTIWKMWKNEGKHKNQINIEVFSRLFNK